MQYESGSDLILVGTVSTEMAPRNQSRKSKAVFKMMIIRDNQWLCLDLVKVGRGRKSQFSSDIMWHEQTTTRTRQVRLLPRFSELRRPTSQPKVLAMQGLGFSELCKVSKCHISREWYRLKQTEALLRRDMRCFHFRWCGFAPGCCFDCFDCVKKREMNGDQTSDHEGPSASPLLIRQCCLLLTQPRTYIIQCGQRQSINKRPFGNISSQKHIACKG